MASSEPKDMPGWSWPDDVPKSEPQFSPDSTANTRASGSSYTRASDSSYARAQRPANSEPSRSASGGTSHNQRNSQSRRRYWPPRQCRICLDTVQPTYHMAPESLPGFLQGAPRVTYESEEGRLLRPCMCKGSSKYVHEGCLQAWRHADPRYGRRNYYECPTCGFRYRLARLGWANMVGSKVAQIALTILILFVAVFFLGFIADPIINLYLDPWSYLMPFSTPSGYYHGDAGERSSWTEHFLKGFTSMGVIGFLKVTLASPFRWFREGRGRQGRATGRDRIEDVGWVIILVGVFTFLGAVYKGVRIWTNRILVKAGEHVMDVQGDDDDEEEESVPKETS